MGETEQQPAHREHMQNGFLENMCAGDIELYRSPKSTLSWEPQIGFSQRGFDEPWQLLGDHSWAMGEPFKLPVQLNKERTNSGSQ